MSPTYKVIFSISPHLSLWEQAILKDILEFAGQGWIKRNGRYYKFVNGESLQSTHSKTARKVLHIDLFQML